MKKNLLFVLLVSASSLASSAQSTLTEENLTVPAPIGHTSSTSTRTRQILDIITSASGETVLFNKSCEGYFRSYTGKYTPYSDAEIPATVVMDDDDVYFLNILSKGLTDTYVKGHKEGNKITVNLPQTVLYNEREKDGYNIDRLKPTEVVSNGETTVTYTIDREGPQYATFTVSEDGTITLDDMGDGCGLGMVFISDDAWNGYVDFKQEYKPLDRPIVEKPASVETQEWVIAYDGTGYHVNVGFDEDEVYIGGMCGNLRSAYFKGRIEGDKVIVPNKQLVGIYSQTYFVYLMAGRVEENKITLSPEEVDFVMHYDSETKLLKPVDPEQLLIFNAAPDRVLVLQKFNDFTIKYQTNSAGIPQNPFNLLYSTDNFEWYGFYSFIFDIPSLGTNGNLLDTQYLYYNILMDGEVMEFTPDDYDVSETMTDIPYLFNNGFDIYSYGGPRRELGIYAESGFDTLGVKLFYNYDGLLTSSATATLDIATGNVTYEDASSVTALNSRTVVAREYYDMSGCRITAPQTGNLYIERVNFSDGSSVTVKNIKR